VVGIGGGLRSRRFVVRFFPLCFFGTLGLVLFFFVVFVGGVFVLSGRVG